MKSVLLAVLAILVSGSAYADGAPDCSKFNNQISYNVMDPIRDILAGKITGSTRMYSDRCERAGQVLEVVLGTDPADASGKRKAQARILVKNVSSGLAFSALTDSMANAQGLANANDLRTFLSTIYGKDKSGNAVDLNSQTWTQIDFELAR